MNTALAARTKKSLQWMKRVGVDEVDVDWLERMEGSIELHMPGNRDRAEHIYKSAITRILASEKPELHIIHTLN